MSDGTRIEWTDASWNPLRAHHRESGKVGWYCTKVSAGCDNCYASTMNKRLGTGLPYKPGHKGDVSFCLDEKALLAPLNWKKPRRIFVCSMTDLFGDWVPDEWIDRMFAVMALAPQHQFQVLTKRSKRMRAYVSQLDNEPVRDTVRRIVAAWPRDKYYPTPIAGITFPLANIWLGVSAEDQQRGDERIPDLLATPAAVRWVSAEPMLGPIDFHHIAGINVFDDGLDDGVKAAAVLDWIVVGGESGPGARPNWTPNIRSIVRQCKAAGVPVFVKQMGSNVRDRNDAGFEGSEPHEWPDVDPFDIEHDVNGYREDHQGAACRIKLVNRKGGDWTEWPEDLRVREYPAAGRLLDGVEHNAYPSLSLEPAK